MNSRRLGSRIYDVAGWPAAALLRLVDRVDQLTGFPFTEPSRRWSRTLNWHGRRITGRFAQPLLRMSNRWNRRSILGDGPPISLTSHGSRVTGAFATIESIGLGRTRPREIVLWLNSAAEIADLAPELRRLQRRGLTVVQVENFGPHTKYFPFVRDRWDGASPLVTADDDLVYPAGWLARLIRAAADRPDAVNAHRAHHVEVDPDGALLPYSRWTACRSDRPDVRTFGTGLSGVWYPPAMLRRLRERGTAFADVCPRADDIWLHFVAVADGIPVRQIRTGSRHFPVLRGSQVSKLQADNVGLSGNDRQIRATYTDDVLGRLAAG